MVYKKRGTFIFLVLIILILWKSFDEGETQNMVHLQGTTMGPIPYSIKYLDEQERSFHVAVDSLLIAFNNSLSTYIPASEISRFNRNDSIEFESPFFYPILKDSREVFERSKGAFDPTIGPLINAWGFGAEEPRELDSLQIRSLLKITGFDKVVFDAKGAVKASDMVLDFSAVAKGYGIDVVADLLKSRGIENFMVEIGGEVACQGVNHLGKPWTIGIQKPLMEADFVESLATVKLKNQAMATSGNYRNYYLKDGKIISHTISPYTGYPVAHNLLSASVFAPNCTLADAYATAFMVLGLEKSKEIVLAVDGLEAFFIYSDEDGDFETFASDGIRSEIRLVD